MKSYFKKKNVEDTSFTGAEWRIFSLKLEGPKMRYEPRGEHDIKKKVGKKSSL